jgi:hypothetical protein
MARQRQTLPAIWLAVTFGAGAVVVATGAMVGAGAAAAPASADSCSQYIEPYNPYLQTCGIPNDPVTVPGASPGAGAIIACRNLPGCLSEVVNGPDIIQVPRPDTTVRQSR